MKRTFAISEIDSVAQELIEQFETKTIAFKAGMGVGKTTLIKALVKALGSEDVVTSPTFSIVNEYHLSSGKIFHFDFYRIKNEEEALNFGIEDYFQSNHWIFMEWYENIPNLLPENYDQVTINLDKNEFRTLKLNNNLTTTQKNAMEQQNF
ncbi:tRNA threonylcarbamoyladenosine biosynthesis protein TsaE [Flavobacteriaceae bacterium MAR_2010_72]|nr:tRNA threonylcarbamoyladenosine biosynthesis protein TsaE [Flavobacteriaceae bacterium MAR_2010_72]TVZ59639.1 tRNA threonylcarbamoyladenosine biosynthesis protein TsaE [Flavobacteriaceae bacterium MAR_2010_105]